MKKILLILLAIFALILVVGAAFYFTHRNAAVVPSNTNGTDFPQGTNSQFSTALQSSNGSTLPVQNFLTADTAKPDTANPGNYILGPQPDSQGGTDKLPYLIEYYPETNYFSIALLKEPLGETRVSVEKYLTGLLGLSNEDLCKLKYSIGVPNSVSAEFAGENLGFSFCPGAVKLP